VGKETSQCWEQPLLPRKLQQKKKKTTKQNPKQQTLRSWHDVSEVKAIQGEKSQ